MTVCKEIILDVLTGKETKTEFSNQEQQAFDKAQQISMQQAETKAQEEQEKSEARLAAEEKLLALGLTTDDLKALLG